MGVFTNYFKTHGGIDYVFVCRFTRRNFMDFGGHIFFVVPFYTIEVDGSFFCSTTLYHDNCCTTRGRRVQVGCVMFST